MAQKKNSNNKSGQLVRQNQKKASPAQPASKKKQQNGMSTLGLPSLGAPVAFSSPTLSMAPRVQSSAKCTRILHRELIATVSGNTTYGVTAYALNPGLSASFPWLSQVAGNYEQYSFKALRYHYVTRCSTTYTGSVLLSPEYDALDSPPTSEVFQAMMEGSKEDVPWRDQLISFSVPDMFPLGPRKFIRTGVVSGSDLKTYDVGQLFVGRAGCTDTNTIGKLWVEYDIELYVPQNPGAGVITGGIGSSSAVVLHAVQNMTDGVGVAVAFDTVGYNGIGITLSGGNVTVPIGVYAINISVTFSAATSLTTCVGLLRLNSATTSPVYGTNSDFNSAIKGGQMSWSALIQTSASTDYFQVLATIGGTGALTLDSDCSQMIFTRVG